MGAWMQRLIERRADLAALAVIAGFFIGFFWPALFGGRFLIAGDSLVYSYALRMAAWDMIRAGTLPLWTPSVFSGYPLLSMAQLGLGYPLTWGYLFLPGHWAEQIYILAPYLLAPVFTYFYVRQIGRSPLAALLAGLSFGYGGLVFSPIGLNGMLSNAVMWLPLVLIAIERARTRHWAPCLLLAAGAYALSVLTGIGQGFVYAGALAIAYAAFIGVFAPAEEGTATPRWLSWARWRPLAVCAGGMVLAAGVAAFQILETAHATRRSVRAVLSYEQFIEGSFTLALIWKSWLDPMHHLGDVTTYVPPLAALLAIVGVLGALRGVRDRRVFFWLAVVVAALVLMLGAYTPLYRLVYYMPVISRFRMPSRHAFEWTFALSVLGAYGWDRMMAFVVPALAGMPHQSSFRRRPGTFAGGALRLKPVLQTFVAVAALVLAVLVALRWKALAAQDAPDAKLIFGDLHASYLGWKAVFTLLICIAAGVALRIAVRHVRWVLAAIAIALVCFIEPALLFARWSLPYSAAASRFTHFAPTTNFVRQSPPEQNRVYSQVHPFVESHLPAPRLDPPNYTALAGLHEVGGYEPLLLERYSRALNSAAWDTVNRTPALLPDATLFGARSHVLDLLNTTFVTAYRGLAIGPGGFEEKEGIQFHESNFGLDVSADAPARFGGAGAESDTLALVTTLGSSSHLNDGASVARVVIRATDGRVIERELRAGLDTADLAHERADVRPTIRHALAPIYDRMPGDEYPAYRYLARLNLGTRLRVERMEIIKLVREAGLGLWKVSLYDSTTGRSTPLAAYDPEHWQPVYEQDGALILRNQRALPRAWLVTEAEALDGTQVWQRIRGLSQQSFDPRRTALIEIEPRKLPQLTGRPLAPDSFARIAHYEPNHLVIETNADQPTILVLSEMHYPGWVATVDGVKTPIHMTDFLLRGVALNEGAHRVEMRYRAPAARQGAVISLLSLLLLGGLSVYTKRKRAG